MESLDPRLNRIDLDAFNQTKPKTRLDQFETYEVFVQAKENKSYQHEGVVHAPNEEMAFLFAKEQFSRRGTCTGIAVCKTENIKTSPTTDNGRNVYDEYEPPHSELGEYEKFDVFHLFRRGKQHLHIGKVEASSYDEAFNKSKALYNNDKTVLNVWVVKTENIMFIDENYRDIWYTLSEKQFREATAYRALDKIKKFKEENSLS
ncbi:MAG: phenylacetic acid degradation b [Cyclobacteriaceae bacterium]|nr:phenylacetic acid degradation b [Cyclobacteriaceae bacterium]